jgi:lauroyl/myristoyl acyltransferase
VSRARSRSQPIAVGAVFWRNCLDWAVVNIPFYFQPLLIFFWSAIFFLFSHAARKCAVRNLAMIRPRSLRIANYLRAFRTFYNFAWSLTDTATYKLLKLSFSYELAGEEFLNNLASAERAIILTAHIGNYDLGAAAFAERFRRPIRMVRAPEPDEDSARFVDHSLEAASVKVDYSGGALVSFDLLGALRNGEIISIQGDRVIENIAAAPVQFFGREISLPTGPFNLCLTADAPIFPLFIIRTGFRKYKITVCPPIIVAADPKTRREALSKAMQNWSATLERVVDEHWEQWYAFAPIF